MTSQSNFVTCKTSNFVCPNIERFRTEIDERIQALELLTANRLPPEEHRLLAKLLPALAGLFGPEPFFAWQVDTPAILAMVDNNMLKLGKLLGRAANTGISFNGLVVRRAGKKQNAQRWRLEERLG